MTSMIPPPSPIALGVMDFCSSVKNIFGEQILTYFSSSESVFYRCVQGISPNTRELIKSIRRVAITYFHELQTVFASLSVASVVYSAYQVVDEVQKNHPLSLISRATQLTMLGSTLPTISLIALTFFISAVASRYFLRASNSNDQSKTQKLTSDLHLSRVILTIALACLSENRMWLVINAIGTA